MEWVQNNDPANIDPTVPNPDDRVARWLVELNGLGLTTTAEAPTGLGTFDSIDYQFSFLPSSPLQTDTEQFGRCGFKIHVGEDGFVQHIGDYDGNVIASNALEEAAEAWFLNFKGYYNSYAYTDTSTMY